MKYKLTNNFIILDNKKLYKIEALRDFATVKKGQLGGWIENENNLSQDGKCWIYGNAKIFGNAYATSEAEIDYNLG